MMDQAAEDEAEGIERFDDFTIASSWERFISEIEAVCRAWLADGPQNLLAKGACPVDSTSNLYKAEKELKYNKKSYSMEFYFNEKHNGKVEVWNGTLHDLQLYFGVDEFLVITPQSANSVVHDSPEASKLMSAVAIALSNCSSSWPAFVLVHDLSRRAYIGIQNLGTSQTRRFEADCLGSHVPAKLMHLEGLYNLFVAKFAFSSVDFSIQDLQVQFSMKLVYRSLPNDETLTGDSGVGLQLKRLWDDDCPWSEWYSVEDPVKGIEVITLWSEKTIGSSTEIAEVENFSPHQAETWLLQATFSETLNDGLKGSTVGFASRLSLLVNALQMSFEAQFLEDFVSVESVSDRKSLGTIPPPTVADRILRELFHEGAGTPRIARVDHKSSRPIKGALLESQFAQFCLHALWFGNCNIRAIATLWIEFVREVNWCWEESQLLPKMPLDGTIDLSTCLINQKLQMLAICIERKREANQEFFDASANHSDMEDDTMTEDSGQKQAYANDIDKKIVRETRKKNLKNAKDSRRNGDVLQAYDEVDPLERVRRGSRGPLGNMMLLNSQHRMHIPFTQDPPLMTEDMHEERMHAIEASGGSFSFSAHLERDILLSDMSSFKAANPGAIFEDFIRWHSPGDWESEVGSEEAEEGNNWPLRGRLSKRMSEQGNSWRKLWDDAPSVPADEQKPLLDADREGEKVLHYLETLRPHQLLEQMVCTSFRASADTMNQTVYGDLNQMRLKMDQLYATMVPSLRPLQVNQLSQESEAIGNVYHLCNVFGQVERATYVAASLHRKFLRASRLSSLMFDDFCNSCLPSSTSTANSDKCLKKIKVRRKERFAVEDLFPIPGDSKSSSWRSVISMGNLLNGHDPVSREIIFSAGGSSDGSAAAHNSSKGAAAASLSVSDGLMVDMYRMYVRGSASDLRVALSLVSCD